MKDNFNDVSIVIPAFNEAKVIGHVIQEIKNQLGKIGVKLG